MSDRRPFTRADDDFLLRETATGVTPRQLSGRLRRSAASIKGRLRNLRAETSRSGRRLCDRCVKGSDGGLDL